MTVGGGAAGASSAGGRRLSPINRTKKQFNVQPIGSRTSFTSFRLTADLSRLLFAAISSNNGICCP